MNKLHTLLTVILISSFAFSGEIPGQRKNITVESITSTESIPITSYYSPLKTDTVVAGAVTVDFNDGNNHYINLKSGATTITLANFPSGGVCKIYLKQPSSGPVGTYILSPDKIIKPSGIAPVLTRTNGAMDILYVAYNGVTDEYDIDVELDMK